MKRIAYIKIIPSVLLIIFFLNACTKLITEPDPHLPINADSPAINSLTKGGPQKYNLADSALIEPSEGANLKIKGRDINGARFKIMEFAFTDPVFVILKKHSIISNSYTLEPQGRTLNEEIEIKLDYDHSPLPYGIREDQLKIFQYCAGGTIELPSQIDIHHMTVTAFSNKTGTFFLGAFDSLGQIIKIEGEFGVRAEKLIKKDKGGRISLGHGSYIEIPKNALNENTLIGAIATRETILGKSMAKGFAFTPHGTFFNIPIKLVLAWPELAGQNVQLYYHNPTTGNWELTNIGDWDYRKHTVTIEVPHFSRYAIAISRARLTTN